MAKDKPHAGPELAEYITTAEPKAHADGVPVFCAHDAIVPVKELRPNPKNPNKHPAEQIKALGAIIRGTGWRNPITVSARSGLIVKGHGRLMAAQLEDLAEVPVDFQNYASEAEELADLTADNRIAELAQTDHRLLADLFVDIDTGEIPFMLSGYTEEEYGNIITALSEAVHDQDDTTEELNSNEDATDDQPHRIAQAGDVWILRDHKRKVDPALLNHIEITTGMARIIIVEVEPRLADTTLELMARVSGAAGVRCVRQGRELSRETIAEILEPDDEGGEQD